MAESTILTGQFVRINQTPASVGERLFALFIDGLLVVLYTYAVTTLFTQIKLWADLHNALFVLAVYLPAWGYPFLCETFNHGRSVGKMLLGLRVVKVDGSTPSLGAYLLRWLLFPVDAFFSGIGLLFVLLTKNNQRLGDLAAGTMVIKEKDYRKIHVSLDEFDYLSRDYRPVYPQAADLSLEQVDVITRTLDCTTRDRLHRIAALARKVELFLTVTSKENDPEQFLRTVLRDYQYYALEEGG